MLISEIVPYERNARHNERAIPKVAESIKEFGLRGTIGLESPDSETGDIAACNKSYEP